MKDDFARIKDALIFHAESSLICESLRLRKPYEGKLQAIGSKTRKGLIFLSPYSSSGKTGSRYLQEGTVAERSKIR